jgi:hypothetical protein
MVTTAPFRSKGLPLTVSGGWGRATDAFKVPSINRQYRILGIEVRMVVFFYVADLTIPKLSLLL